MLSYNDMLEGAAALRTKLCGFEPEILIILGSGLGRLGELIPEPLFIPYGEIPHMRQSVMNSSCN